MNNISIAPQFQKSIKINADIDKIDAIKNYIPLKSSIDTLQLLARNIYEKSNSAFTVIGPYGSGKSITILVLASLLSQKRSISKKAKELLLLNSDKNDYISKVFLKKTTSWKTLCIVGSKRSLRDILSDELWKLQKTLNIDCDDLNNNHNDFFDRLSHVLENKHLLLVIDELGKFLEYSINDKDIYFLQELAEFATRSNGKLVLIGILHQSFDAYIKNFNKSIRDEWQKVQGRFENLYLQPSPYESLLIISKSIQNADLDKNTYLPLINSISTYLNKTTLSFNNEMQSIFAGMLPIHPLTAIALAAISKKAYGQNERSIYNLLNSLEPFSFKDFLKTESNKLYCLNHFFDYLKTNLDITISTSNDGHNWEIAKDLIDRCEIADKNEWALILKNITMIELFASTYRLSPTCELIAQCLMIDKSIIEVQLEELQKHKFIIYRNYDSAYHLFIRSDFNFDLELTKELVKTDFSLDVLNQFLNTNVKIIAKRHYIQTGNLRWFKVSLIEEDNSQNYISKVQEQNDVVGEFIIILSESNKTISIPKKRNVIISYLPKTSELINLVRTKIALDNLIKSSLLEGDPVARKEVSLRLVDIDFEIKKIIDEAIQNCEWKYLGEKIGKLNSFSFSSLASDIADNIFDKSFIIKNELINKNKLSANIVSARKTLMKKMLEDQNKEDLNFTSMPAEFCIYDNLLNTTGLHYFNKKTHSYEINYHSDTITNKQLLNFFKDTEFFIDNRTETTLIDLYSFWRSSPYGMKEGPMPIYALIFIMSNINKYAFYDQYFYISNFDEDKIDEILYFPELFKIKTIVIEKQKQHILENIQTAIKCTLNVSAETTPIALSRVLYKFIYSLPNLTKRTDKISKQARKLRSFVINAIDPIDLVYNKILSICNNINDSPKELSQILYELNSFYKSQLSDLLNIFFNMFNQKDRNLNNLLKRAKPLLEQTTSTRIQGLINLITNYKDNEINFIENLIRFCSEDIITKWSDMSIEKTLVDIPKLSLEFRQAECFANAKNISSQRRMLALTFASAASKDATIIAEIDPNDEPIVKEKTQEMVKLLSKLDKNLQIAILAELGVLFTKK